MNRAFLEFLSRHLLPLANPQFRKDPIVDRWVIVSTDRAQRPFSSHGDTAPAAKTDCPFCEGNERATPTEAFALRDRQSSPNQSGWQVRVVPNKFPALAALGDANLHNEGTYDSIDGVGAHEVIVECPQHEKSLARLSHQQVSKVVTTYRERLLALKEDRRLAYGMLFKNVGEAAGASIEHCHAQLIGLPMVPVMVRDELAGAAKFLDRHQRCIFCDLLSRELAAKHRIVCTTERFIAVTPFASRFSFETWVLPRTHQSHFEDLEPADIDEFASILKAVLMKLDAGLGRPAYNYFIHTAPLNVPPQESYHWHLEILPCFSRVAGFEWGTGCYINPVPPEQAAAFLRGTEI
jgi:UDPglucose--hexose-1-phosphate uridylyltransferase